MITATYDQSDPFGDSHACHFSMMWQFQCHAHCFRRNKFYKLLHWLGRDTALPWQNRVIRHKRSQPKFWQLLTDCLLIFCQFHNLFYFLRIQIFIIKRLLHALWQIFK